MPDLQDGESVEVKGSGSAMYRLKNVGGVYSCSCPAWRNQSIGIERRTCKHLKAYRGADVELARVGNPAPRAPTEGAETEHEGPPLLLAERWENDVELAGWWMSEKLDGVRAYWDGKGFTSRLGNPYLAPDWFLEKLPQDVILDGELWIDRKAFQRTISVVRRQDKSDLWKQVHYRVFDAPAIKETFEKRIEFCRQLFEEKKPPFAQWHPQERCLGLDHLKTELARVNGLGGEGLMLRQPGSLYQVGRSSTLLKVKTFHDAEATVLEHLPGAGRHLGRLGALLVQMPDGTRFSVGTGFSDAERGKPPPVGSTVSYRYQELSEAGVPRFPSYIGLRTDVPVVAAAPASASAAKPAPSQGLRRFEFVQGESAKFWEIETAGAEQTGRFGRIGFDGQEKKKQFSDPAAAAADSQRLVAEKTGKGYVEK